MAAVSRRGPPDPAAGRATLGWKLSVIATALAVAGALAMLFLPLGRSASVEATSPGEEPAQPVVTSFSLYEAEGWYAVAIAAIPVALAALTLPFRNGPSARVARAGSAGLLTVFFVLGLLTIGFFFIPAAVVMWVAAFVRR
jgi:hypothetical protein